MVPGAPEPPGNASEGELAAAADLWGALNKACRDCGKCWRQTKSPLFTVVRKYPADRLPSPEAVKLFCELGGGDSEVLQSELLGRPRAAGGVHAPGDLPLGEGPPHGLLLLKEHRQGSWELSAPQASGSRLGASVPE